MWFLVVIQTLFQFKVRDTPTINSKLNECQVPCEIVRGLMMKGVIGQRNSYKTIIGLHLTMHLVYPNYNCCVYATAYSPLSALIVH